MATEVANRLVWSVAGLLNAVVDALSNRFGACVVEGEIAGFSRAGSGHCYFALKDAKNHELQIRCVMFRRAGSLLDFSPADGMVVQIRGRLTLYEARGDLQLVVEVMRRAGDGALMERFLRLKEKLDAEGLFHAGRKRAIAAYPRRIGVVTSPDAAALHDVVAALQRRAPHVELIIYPSLVQGPSAVEPLLRALAIANRRSEVDMLLLCRGGGSMEDLWSFNDERVVRAVAQSGIPVIAGVGHETDVTLTDFAADVRAPTPTAAAELAAPSRPELWQALIGLSGRIGRSAVHRLESHGQRLDRLAMRLARPGRLVERHQQLLTEFERRMLSAIRRAVHSAQTSLAVSSERLHNAPRHALQAQTMAVESLGARLGLLDPLQVVARGYALLQTPDGRVVRAPSQLRRDEVVRVSLADGVAMVRIGDVRQGH